MQHYKRPHPYSQYQYEMRLIQRIPVKVKQPPVSKPKKSSRRRLKIFRWSRNTINYVKIYFQHSSMHGFQYVVKQSLTWLERFFWFLLLIISTYLLIRIGLQSVDRYYNKSTVVGIERDFSYWNTSLPSITVCPLQRLNETLVDEFCSLHNIAGQNRDELKHFLEQLANSTYANFENIADYPSIDAILAELKIQPAHYIELIYNLTTDNALQPDPSKRIVCKHGRGLLRVRQVLTEFGLCYMTNSYLSDQVTARYLIFGNYPDANISSGEERVYNILQSPFKDAIYFNLGGFTCEDIYVYVHGAYEMMRIDNIYYYLNGVFSLYPDVIEIKTEPGFEQGSTVSQRKCRFQHESNLEHFPLYSKNMCLQECRLNLAYQTCKCIPHFYPNRIANPKPVCSYKILKSCFPEHANYLIKLFRGEDHDGDHDEGHEAFSCDCLENCEDTIVAIRDVNFESNSGSMMLYGGIGAMLKFDNWPRSRLVRQIIYSFTDLLVSIGGTAGLFLGVSVLNMVEVLYFFSLRLVYYLRGYILD